MRILTNQSFVTFSAQKFSVEKIKANMVFRKSERKFIVGTRYVTMLKTWINAQGKELQGITIYTG